MLLLHSRFSEGSIVPISALFGTVCISSKIFGRVNQLAAVCLVQCLLVKQGHKIGSVNRFWQTGWHLPAIGAGISKLQCAGLTFFSGDQYYTVCSFNAINRS